MFSTYYILQSPLSYWFNWDYVSDSPETHREPTSMVNKGLIFFPEIPRLPTSTDRSREQTPPIGHTWCDCLQGRETEDQSPTPLSLHLPN